jgi:enoyl-CoA hydratase/carnithine racemase
MATEDTATEKANDSTLIGYEKIGERIACITLDRPERANAQNYRLLYQLNDAFDRAAADDEVRVRAACKWQTFLFRA